MVCFSPGAAWASGTCRHKPRGPFFQCPDHLLAGNCGLTLGLCGSIRQGLFQGSLLRLEAVNLVNVEKAEDLREPLESGPQLLDLVGSDLRLCQGIQEVAHISFLPWDGYKAKPRFLRPSYAKQCWRMVRNLMSPSKCPSSVLKLGPTNGATCGRCSA